MLPGKYETRTDENFKSTFFETKYFLYADYSPIMHARQLISLLLYGICDSRKQFLPFISIFISEKQSSTSISVTVSLRDVSINTKTSIFISV